MRRGDPTRVAGRRGGAAALFAAIVVGVVAAGCATTSGGDARTTESDRAAARAGVRRFLDRYAAAFESADPDALRSLYASDARFGWYEAGRLQYESPDAIVRSFERFASAGASVELSDARIAILGPDAAHVATAFRTTIAASEANEIQFEGVMTMLLERTDSAWRILRGHSSSRTRRDGGARGEAR